MNKKTGLLGRLLKKSEHDIEQWHPIDTDTAGAEQLKNEEPAVMKKARYDIGIDLLKWLILIVAILMVILIDIPDIILHFFSATCHTFDIKIDFCSYAIAYQKTPSFWVYYVYPLAVAGVYKLSWLKE